MTALLLLLLAAVVAVAAVAVYIAFRQRRVQRALFGLHPDLDAVVQRVHVVEDGLRRSHDPRDPEEGHLSLRHLDHARSPHTGLTRDSWIDIAGGMLERALAHTNGMRGPLDFPASLAAGYPGLTSDARRGGPREAYLEAFARTLLLAAPLLRNRPEMRMHGRSVADYYLEFLLRGVSTHEACAFGRGERDGPAQRILEAATVAFALGTSREALWEPLSGAERARVVRWLDGFKSLPVNPNNWRWFSVMLNTFLKREGEAYDEAGIKANLAALERFYVDAGWSRDLDKFDYYSAWVLQFYPIFWALWDGDSRPELRDRLFERNDLFLQSFSHLYSREGHLPLWGRSVCYRFGASAPLAVAFLRPTAPAIDAGFARRLCSGNLLQFVRHPDFLRHGVPSLGFYGERKDLVDGYSCVASPYWCAKLFMGLLVPPESPFWTATESEGFWSDPPARYSIGRTGMWVEHDASTGHSRLCAPQDLPFRDSRYTAPYFDTADTVYDAGRLAETSALASPRSVRRPRASTAHPPESSGRPVG